MFEFFKNIYPKKIAKKIRKEGEFLIVTNDNLELYVLNPTASFFLINSNGNNSVNEIMIKMLKEFDVEENILKNDICNIIRDFQWKNLISLEASK